MDSTDDSKVCAAIRDTRASTWMPEPFRGGSSIEWAHHAARAAVRDVRGAHRRPHVLVAEQGLDGANVRARLQEVRGEAAPQRVAGGAPVDLRRSRRVVYGPLHRRLVQLVQDGAARRRIGTGPGGGKDMLPGERRRRAGHLGAQDVREIDFAAAGLDFSAVASCHLVELRAQCFADANTEQRRAIVTSFATTHHDLVAIEVNVLDPQRQAFEQAEAGPATGSRVVVTTARADRVAVRHAVPAVPQRGL